MPAKSKDFSAGFFHHAGTYPAPAGFPPAARALWGRIMRSTPAGQFRDGDLPLLTLFCRVSLLAGEAVQHLEQDGQVSADGKVSPWVKVASDHGKTLALLASKLRLAPSSRIRAESHSLRQQPAFGGPFADDPEGLLAE